MISCGVVGDAVVSGCAFGLVTEGVQIFVGGVEVAEGRLQLGTLSFKSNLRGSGDARFRLFDRAQTLHFEFGADVWIYRDGVRLFGGSVQRAEESTPPSKAGISGGNFIDVEAVDYSAICDRHQVSDNFAAGLKQGDIVRELVANTTKAAVDGVTVANVQDGLETDGINFPDRKLSDCLDSLAKLTGLVWRVSPWKELFFHEREFVDSGKEYGVNNRKYDSSSIAEDGDDYGNAMLLKAGKQPTDLITGESEEGDGEKRTFEARYPLAEKPVIRVNGVTVDPANIGVRGVDAEKDDDGNPTNFEWFYKVDDTSITQSFEKTVVGDGIVVEWDYKGLFDVKIAQESESEQTRMSEVTGGSGEFWKVKDDRSIDGFEQATARAIALLDEIDTVKKVVKVSVWETGIEPGMTVQIDFPEHAIAGRFLVESVVVSQVGENVDVWRTQVELTDARRAVSHFDFWREQYKGEFTIRENERLQIIRQRSETISVVTSTTVVQTGTPNAFSTDGFSVGLYGAAGSEWGNTRWGTVQLP